MSLWHDLEQTIPSPLEALKDDKWAQKEVRFYVKRDDLLAPTKEDPFCGNKWRKLKYNLLFAKEKGIKTLLSFGGAYSNHIAALASAGHHLGFKTIGIIRGEVVANPTLDRAKENGMQLHFVDRNTYRKKNEAGFLNALQQTHGPCLIIPEGGTNALALKGTSELAQEILCQQPKLSHIALPCGTGGTMAGVIDGLQGQSYALGVSVLKGHFMTKEVAQLSDNNWKNWHIEEEYHHGGYAKKTETLLQFMDGFYLKHHIQLEPIYSGKLFYALYQLLDKGFFKKGSTVVAVHTGGLQYLPK